MTDLSERVAVVTGSGTGIGRGIALKLAELGATVVVNGRREQPCAETAEQIRDEGGTATVVTGDVADSAVADALIGSACERFGKVDVLVNNAGIQRVAWVDQMTDDEWDEVMRTNLKGPFVCSRAFVRQMRPNRFGRIINIGSDGALSMSSGTIGNTNYVTTKAGLLGMTMAIALEMTVWARRDSADYTCNLITPGFCESEMSAKHPREHIDSIIAALPLRRPGDPRDEIGAVVGFLASSAASHVTGAKFSAGGGVGMCIAS